MTEKKPKKQITVKGIISLMIIATVMIGLPIGFLIGSYSSFSSGQMVTWDIIAKGESDLLGIYSNETQTVLSQRLPHGCMNFTNGLIWESSMMNFTFDRPQYQNVPQVLTNGKGACGEHVWVYAAFCVAKGIPFRVVHVGYFVPGVVDHSWIQVNPLNDGISWIHVEVAGSCAGLQNGKTIDQLWNDTINNNNAYKEQQYKMVLAYQLIDNQIVITDVTSTFSPKK
jgi:hypothetical protein